MIQINLLPIRTKKRRETARQFVSVYFLSIVLVVAGMGYLWMTKNSEISERSSRLSQLQQEVAKYAKYEALLKEVTQKKEVVDKKRGVIKSLQEDRDSIVRILALLSVKLPPEKIWFDKLGQNQNTISLDGVASSNEALAEFMRNLESSPYVDKSSLNLVLSRQTVIAERKLRQFQLTYRFFPYSVVEKNMSTRQKAP
jgi:type IV pilus assembly protein PilN